VGSLAPNIVNIINKIMKKALILIIVFLFFILSINTCWAKFPNNLPEMKIMPDNPFYFLKIWYEKIITFFNFGDEAKAERYSKLAEKRLEEAKEMAEKGKQKLTEILLKNYNKYLNKAKEKVEKLQ